MEFIKNLTNIEKVIIALIFILLILIFIGQKAEFDKYSAFINECSLDKKRYECESMWRDATTGRDIAAGLAIGGALAGGRR